jgi:hypothetical protein
MKKTGEGYINPDKTRANPAVGNVTGADGDCVAYKNGSLISAACDTPAFFICENMLANGT